MYKKLKKNKNYKIYQVLNTLNGEMAFVDFKPSKDDICNVEHQEYWAGRDINEIRDNVKSGYYIFNKIDVFSK